MSFVQIDVKEISGNPWKMIGDEWMLVSASNPDFREGKVNTMTASWGGVGVIWGKVACTAYIRPQRYTKEFIDGSEYFTLTFFGGEEKKALGYLGKVSGRDVPDKITEAGLHVTEVEGQPAFEEASLVLVCKKMYAQEMKKECFIDEKQIDAWYKDNDYHTMYIAEIVSAWQKA